MNGGIPLFLTDWYVTESCLIVRIYGQEYVIYWGKSFMSFRKGR